MPLTIRSIRPNPVEFDHQAVRAGETLPPRRVTFYVEADAALSNMEVQLSGEPIAYDAAIGYPTIPIVPDTTDPTKGSFEATINDLPGRIVAEFGQIGQASREGFALVEVRRINTAPTNRLGRVHQALANDGWKGPAAVVVLVLFVYWFVVVNMGHRKFFAPWRLNDVAQAAEDARLARLQAEEDARNTYVAQEPYTVFWRSIFLLKDKPEYLVAPDQNGVPRVFMIPEAGRSLWGSRKEGAIVTLPKTYLQWPKATEDIAIQLLGAGPGTVGSRSLVLPFGESGKAKTYYGKRFVTLTHKVRGKESP